MRSICVFAASSSGTSQLARSAAYDLGKALALRDLTLVYGGARVGLMGELADGAISAGGTVIGVMPRSLVDKEIAHGGLSELHIVETLHERKLMMSDISDGFVALPGGPGTFEELFEQWTWAQLGYHKKPCGILEIDGFFDPLKELIGQMGRYGYLSESHADMIVFDAVPASLIDRFFHYRAPQPKWIKNEQPLAQLSK